MCFLLPAYLSSRIINKQFMCFTFIEDRDFLIERKYKKIAFENFERPHLNVTLNFALLPYFLTNHTLYLSRVYLLTTTNIDESHFWIIRVRCALNVRKLPIICCNQISSTICRIYYDGALYYYLFAGVYGKGYETCTHAVNRIKIDVLPRVIRKIIKLTCYTSSENNGGPVHIQVITCNWPDRYCNCKSLCCTNVQVFAFIMHNFHCFLNAIIRKCSI